MAAIALIAFFRKPDALLHPQFWAEDGAIFFEQAREHGFRAFFLPYPDYLLVSSRLLAWLFNPLPVLWQPALYSYGTLLGLLALTLFILHSRIDPRCRPWLALTLMLVPHNGEVFLTHTNFQWILAPVLWLLVLQGPPQNRWQAGLDFAVLFFAGLSGPFGTLFAPLFLGRLWLPETGGRSRYNFALLGVAVAVAVVQAALVLHGSPQRPPVTEPAAAGALWLKAIGFAMPADLFFGAQLPRYFGRGFWVLTPLLLIVAGWLLAACDWRKRRRILALLLGGGLVYAAALFQLRAIPFAVAPFGMGARYSYLPSVALAWCLVLLWFDARRAVRRVAAGALFLLALSSATNFTTPRQTDYHWSDYAARIEAGETLRVPIPPGFSFEARPRPSR